MSSAHSLCAAGHMVVNMYVVLVGNEKIVDNRHFECIKYLFQTDKPENFRRSSDLVRSSLIVGSCCSKYEALRLHCLYYRIWLVLKEILLSINKKTPCNPLTMIFYS